MTGEPILYDDCQDAVRQLILLAGDDPTREGLKDTPARVIRAYKEMFAGYTQNPDDLLKEFEVQYDGMVVVTNIDFCSVCEHHMMPFAGVAHVGYVPNGKVIGLSKLARLVDIYARRLQVQERLADQIVAWLDKSLKPLGCGVVIHAQHGCMTCRGVKKQNATMQTDSLRGSFKTDAQARSEFLLSCMRR